MSHALSIRNAIAFTPCLVEIPLDPFNGKPLRLAIKNNQWIIYSVGPDQIDNGGVDIEHGKGDVIFTLQAGTD
jgi:hypothetical protein